MKRFIAWIFGLITKEQLIQARLEIEQIVVTSRRIYYQKVLNELRHNGSLPPNCDLVMPKERLRIVNTETNDIVAEGGKWKRQPADGEKVTISYDNAEPTKTDATQ